MRTSLGHDSRRRSKLQALTEGLKQLHLSPNDVAVVQLHLKGSEEVFDLAAQQLVDDLCRDLCNDS